MGLSWRILALSEAMLSQRSNMIPHLDDKMRPKSANNEPTYTKHVLQKTWKKTERQKPCKTLGFLMFCIFSVLHRHTHFEASWSQLERRWEPGWRQDGQLGAQDGQLGAQDGQLGSVLGAFLAHLKHLGASFIENAENIKTSIKLSVFAGFWVVWGIHFDVFGGHVGLCWRILAPS